MQTSVRAIGGKGMQVSIHVNGTLIKDDIQPDMVLLDFLRAHGYFTVSVVVKQQTADFVQCG